MAMIPLDLINLSKLMDLTSGSSEIKIGLIDGPVAFEHKDLKGTKMQQTPGNSAFCGQAKSSACAHGTFYGRHHGRTAKFGSLPLLGLYTFIAHFSWGMQ